jgi:hypothetical protein
MTLLATPDSGKLHMHFIHSALISHLQHRHDLPDPQKFEKDITTKIRYAVQECD